jgi:hypothetical protein
MIVRTPQLRGMGSRIALWLSEVTAPVAVGRGTVWRWRRSAGRRSIAPAFVHFVRSGAGAAMLTKPRPSGVDRDAGGRAPRSGV